ncbi:hypothetical protein [Halorussus pelagicus]|uniref:hypothetical protein n=1 Tax=Halorussus pelagicus TaxID=2505977 RepID=UPI000FFC272B|nr:hypothetical protein [Halorussus pelagicus]
MRRIWFALFGGLFGAVGVAFLGAFRADALADPTSLATFSLWLGASTLYVLGGLDASIGDFDWYQLVGLGNVCLGLQMVARAAMTLADGTGETEPLLATFGGVVGGLTLAYIGLDWFRGGRHFDLSTFEESPTADPE